MIESLSGKFAFDQLRAMGVKARCGPLSVTHRTDLTPPAIAFAVPRRIGTAVVRNRIRRRLRAVFHNILKEVPESLAGGDYLFYVSAPLEGFSSLELHALIANLLEDVARCDGAVVSTSRDVREVCPRSASTLVANNQP